jgi:large subunit ribosomal protein L18
MKKTNVKADSRQRRHARIRARISGTKEMPRLSIFKSNRHMYAQLIDDTTGTTILGLSSEKAEGKNMMEKAKDLGKMVAKAAIGKKITSIAFDRGGFKYTGKIKLFADAAREGGLKF